MNKYLLRVDEAAMLLNVSRWTIYRWVQEGRLEATKVGKGSLRIFQVSVVSLIEQNRTLGVEPVHRHDGRRSGAAHDGWRAGLQ